MGLLASTHCREPLSVREYELLRLAVENCQASDLAQAQGLSARSVNRLLKQALVKVAPEDLPSKRRGRPRSAARSEQAERLGLWSEAPPLKAPISAVVVSQWHVADSRDALLMTPERMLAEWVKPWIRDRDWAQPWGAEEVVVLAEATDERGVERIRTRLRAVVGQAAGIATGTLQRQQSVTQLLLGVREAARRDALEQQAQRSLSRQWLSPREPFGKV